MSTYEIVHTVPGALGGMKRAQLQTWHEVVLTDELRDEWIDYWAGRLGVDRAELYTRELKGD